jgi:hypothetical protein
MQNQYRELVTLYDRTNDIQGVEFVNRQPIFSTCSLSVYCKLISACISMLIK